MTNFKSISALVIAIVISSVSIMNKEIATTIADSVNAHNPVLLPALSDKISHAIGGKTNGLYEVSTKEILALTDDTKAQVRFLQCSVSTETDFRFSNDCHTMRYKGYMTKYNFEPLNKLKKEMYSAKI
ncbi:hypothetical protein V4100_000990 [Pseudomonas aeruginosa]